MFSTLIVTLTVAAVHGLPQPQYLLQFLPIIQPSTKSSIYENKLYDESDYFNRDVSLYYKRPGEKDRFIVETVVEPNKINKGLTEIEISKDEAYRATFTRAEDIYAGSRRHVRLRNGSENNGMAFMKLPIERREGYSHENDDVVVRNARLMQKTDVSTFKPFTVLKNSFTSNSDTKHDNTVTSFDSNERNKSINRNTSRKIVSTARNIISHGLSRTNMPSQNDTNSSYLDSITNANKTSTQHIITEAIIEPVNGKTSKKLVAEVIENSTQVIVNSGEPENPVKPVSHNGSRSGLYNPASDEEDRWIWGTTEKVETTTPDIENRVSFDGGSCPTGKVKIAGICVVPDRK